jgi:hypothetical protein
MATSVFFHNFDSAQEQELLEDLVIESIRIYGVDMKYAPRRLGNKDEVYGADDISYFDRAYDVEMYVTSVDGFTGDKTFFSKFGLEIRDQVKFQVAKRVFQHEVAQHEDEMLRPREGDLVYFPLNDKCFQIKFVDTLPVFYQMGTMQTYELTCELFEYSSERMMTGYEPIDRLQREHSLNILDYAILTETGAALVDEVGDYVLTTRYDMDRIDPFVDNDAVQTESDTILDWSETDPLSDGRQY